jgi:hypothetical protein
MALDRLIIDTSSQTPKKFIDLCRKASTRFRFGWTPIEAGSLLRGFRQAGDLHGNVNMPKMPVHDV